MMKSEPEPHTGRTNSPMREAYVQPKTAIKMKLGALKLRSEIEKLEKQEVNSVTYCAEDGCCWHDDRPVPGDEVRFQLACSRWPHVCLTFTSRLAHLCLMFG